MIIHYNLQTRISVRNYKNTMFPVRCTGINTSKDKDERIQSYGNGIE
jgi:hypothetical protein